MAKPLTDYFENLRAALSDPGTEGAFAWQNAQLASGLRMIVQTGLGPRGVGISDDNLSLDPEPATPDARGYLIFQTALCLIGGSVNTSFKTRALSVIYNPNEKAQTIEHLRRMIAKLEGNGDPHGIGGASFFGVWQDFENAVARSTPDPEQNLPT